MIGGAISAAVSVMLGGAWVANMVVPESYPAESAYKVPGLVEPTVDLAALAQSAPATALNLLLRGTLNENAPDGGIAIIAEGSGPDQAYRVGDTLPGGARLDGI